MADKKDIERQKTPEEEPARTEHDPAAPLADERLPRTEPKEAAQFQTKKDGSSALWTNMLVQIPPVVVAVLLAFAINAWYAQRQQTRLTDRSVARIDKELDHNLGLYRRMIALDSQNLIELEREIEEIEAGNYRENGDYGEGMNLFILNEGAWQAASLSNAISGFAPNRLEALSNIYTIIHFRNVEHSSIRPPAYALYDESTLLPYLKENRVVLNDHMNNCKYEQQLIVDYLADTVR